MSKEQKQNSYADSGVNIDKANEAIKGFKDKVFSTFNANVLNDLSSYSGLFKLDIEKFSSPVLVSSTDGVGTKILIAKSMNDFTTIGQDLVAMSVNDIICCGAEPLFFLDYIACGKLVPEKIEEIVASVADACKFAGAALIGGETAEMPGIYKTDDIDLAGFAVGIIDRKSIIDKNKINPGDILFGLTSTGPHSNGYSLIRKIIADNGLDLQKDYSISNNSISLGKTLISPTKIYVQLIKKIKEKLKIKGIAHITGGGFYENINRILPESCDALINKGSWLVPDIFRFLQKYGNVSEKEMYRVFNMGIGMAIIINKNDADVLLNIMDDLNEDIFKIGEIIPGGGEVIINGI
ncbi:MAG: phosphoribosylformylglycinamidine cyclo-ligase [Actinomycetota bacterium]|nr:phosphoribosylformylglycinamidine cyclo-ligase [Actinomycetota bacterium]